MSSDFGLISSLLNNYNPNGQYNISINPSSMPNANYNPTFSPPNVTVSQGMLNETLPNLQMVLGHELAHGTFQHSAQDAAIANQQAQTPGGLSGQLFDGYRSQQFEAQADRQGMSNFLRAGGDPSQLTMFQNPDNSGPLNPFRDHPTDSSRLQSIQDMASRDNGTAGLLGDFLQRQVQAMQDSGHNPSNVFNSLMQSPSYSSYGNYGNAAAYGSGGANAYSALDNMSPMTGTDSTANGQSMGLGATGYGGNMTNNSGGGSSTSGDSGGGGE